MKHCSDTAWLIARVTSLAVLVFICAGCSRKQAIERVIAYVGRYTNAADSTSIDKQKPNPFDLLHEHILRRYVEDLNRANREIQYTLRTFDCRRTAAGSDSVYKYIVADSTIVAVIDNTWGIQLQGAATRIRDASIPLVALNADHSGVDYGPSVLFTGTNDAAPYDLATYIEKALHVSSVNFLCEKDYALTNAFRKAFDAHHIDVHHEFDVHSSNDATPRGLSDALGDIVRYYKQFPEESKRLLVMNVHSNWGNALLKSLDTAIDGLMIIGHAYIANGDALENFGRNTKTDLLLVTNPTDAVSRKVHADLAQARHERPDIFNNINAPLFVKRCIDAMEILGHVLNDSLSKNPSVFGHSESNQVSSRVEERSLLARRIESLRNNVLAGNEDLYRFDAAGDMVQDVHVSRYHRGELLSLGQQLNSERVIIPNLVFGMEIQDIYDLVVASNSFTADFYYWVKMDSSQREAEKYISFQNMKSSQSTRELVIENIEGAMVYRLYRVSGNFYVNYNLADFPFDSQELCVNVEMLNPDDRMKISFDKNAFLLDPQTIEKYKVTGWNKNAYYVTVDNRISRSVKGDPQGKEGTMKKFKNFAFRLEVSRIALGSFLQIILPLVLIGMVAVSLLFIRNLSFENVGEVSVGVFLSIIAFSISLSGMIPSSNYLTRADLLFWITFVVVFGSFMTVIVLNSLYEEENLRHRRFKGLGITLSVVYPALCTWALFL